MTLVLAISAIADAGCLTEPWAWTRPGGRPMDVSRYRRDTQTCRESASVLYFAGDDPSLDFQIRGLHAGTRLYTAL